MSIEQFSIKKAAGAKNVKDWTIYTVYHGLVVVFVVINNNLNKLHHCVLPNS